MRHRIRVAVAVAESLAEAVIQELTVTPLKLALDRAADESNEIGRTIRARFGLAPVRGYCVLKAIPFTGDPVLWRFPPGSSRRDSPYGQLLRQTLYVGMALPEQEVEHAAAEIEHAMRMVVEYLESQEAPIASFNRDLPYKVLEQVRRRRANLMQQQKATGAR